jgi:hypothetical protein
MRLCGSGAPWLHRTLPPSKLWQQCLPSGKLVCSTSWVLPLLPMARALLSMLQQCPVWELCCVTPREQYLLLQHRPVYSNGMSRL